MAELQSQFIFAVCQAGAESALKQELAREHPELRFAYSRPGFVTFKRADGAPLGERFELRSVFARAYGLSLGKASDAAGVRELALRLGAPGTRLRLHVFERERHVPGEEPLGFEPGALAAQARAEILASAGELFLEGEVAQDGERVLDVAVVEEREWWLGAHAHGPAHSPHPGGKPRISLPPEAPSRAYLKLEEGVLWGGLPLRAGDTAVEIGSAPGGATYALLKRGVNVVGIDPGEMDPVVFKAGEAARFKHIRKPVASVAREELPESVQWLLLDMNVAPSVSLFAVDRLATRMKDSLLGILLTVKLNQWKMAAEIPSMLEHVRAMGMARARAAQLPSNRQEICIAGLTRKATARLAR